MCADLHSDLPGGKKEKEHFPIRVTLIINPYLWSLLKTVKVLTLHLLLGIPFLNKVGSSYYPDVLCPEYDI